MPIHEKSLIRPENLLTHEKLVLDGVDVSGHWSTFIAPRVVTDYNERLQEEIAALDGGENIHRCWQCGSCTNACTVNAINPDFNPRYWIYLIRLGMEAELVRDKDIIWQCVSCHKCTSACPRDVVPEGVMKATARWLELKGHTPKPPPAHFDEEFTEQIVATGRIEEGRVIRNFFRRTNQPLMQDWLTEMGRRLASRLPFLMMFRMGYAAVFRPRTRRWAKARVAIAEHIEAHEADQRRALDVNDPPRGEPQDRGVNA
jgi:heterodisulfide reductase subunit C2